LIAHEIRVLEAELECFKLPEIPIGTRSHGAKISEAWQAKLSAPESREQISIRVEYDGQRSKRTIVKRQTLNELQARLKEFPKKETCCHWILPNGREIDETVAFHEWHSGEVLKIWKTPTAFTAEVYGRQSNNDGSIPTREDVF
jgi:hypothetical protein